jgi:hypothetical protein
LQLGGLAEQFGMFCMEIDGVCFWCKIVKYMINLSVTVLVAAFLSLLELD